MKRKNVMIMILLAAMALFIAGCSSGTSADNAEQTPPEDLPVFTLDELAQYDGKDGNKAYIAVDGVVYDVTEVKSWAEGMHNGFNAGADQTEALDSKAPHGAGMLNGVPVVGTLEE